MTKSVIVTIRFLSLLGLFFCGLVGAVFARTGVLVLGDSLSAAYGIPAQSGWVELLEDRLQARDPAFDVINASISGDTSRGGLARLPAALERHRPQVVIIELGGNDGLRGLSLGRLRENLEQMIRMTRENGAMPLLVGVKLPANYGRRFGERFHAIFGEVAETMNVPLVPFLLENVAMDRALMQADGIHPTLAAQPILLENVWPVLAPLLDRQRAQAGRGLLETIERDSVTN